jgi:hypothetical protein
MSRTTILTLLDERDTCQDPPVFPAKGKSLRMKGRRIPGDSAPRAAMMRTFAPIIRLLEGLNLDPWTRVRILISVAAPG